MGTRRKPRHSRPVGRPPKIMEEAIRTTLLDSLKVGATITLSCEAAGLSIRTFQTWMQRGYDAHETQAEGLEVEETEVPYMELYQAVQSARAAAAVRNVGVIQRVANGGTVLERTTEKDPDGTERVIEKRQAPDWRAAAWWLERSYKGDFTKEATQVELTGAGGGPVQMTVDAQGLAARLTEHLAVGAATTPLAIESTQQEPDPESETEDGEVVD